MTSPLKDRITDDMKAAMRAKDSDRLTTIRMLTAAIKQREVDERIVIEDSHVLSIVDKMIKQRRDAIAQFDAGGRPELSAKERQEIEWLAVYMPEQADASVIDAEIEAALAAVESQLGKRPGTPDMGRVMAVLKPRLAGKADMSAVSAKLKAALAG
ncbi:GatB/YqeY domain-containing protein [soil metagenome]